MTWPCPEIARSVALSVAVGVMSGGTFYVLNTLNVATASLATERRALDEEHAANERMHEASRLDRLEMRRQLSVNHRIIEDLLDKVKAGQSVELSPIGDKQP